VTLATGFRKQRASVKSQGDFYKAILQATCNAHLFYHKQTLICAITYHVTKYPKDSIPGKDKPKYLIESLGNPQPCKKSQIFRKTC
jgi:hypothetical protein